MGVNTEIMFAKLQMLGQYLDTSQGLIYLRFSRNPNVWNKLCSNFTPTKAENEKSYQMVIVETDANNRMTPVEWYIASSKIKSFTEECLFIASRGLW